MGKTLSSLLTLLALVYGGIAALLFFFQQKLTYTRRSVVRFNPRRATTAWTTRR